VPEVALDTVGEPLLNSQPLFFLSDLGTVMEACKDSILV